MRAHRVHKTYDPEGGKMSERVSDTKSMIAGMSPELRAGAYDFCTLPVGDARLDGLIPQARAVCQEAEGGPLILSILKKARRGGFALSGGERRGGE